MYEMRKINADEVEEALALALEVFLQFEAPDYQAEGVESFRKFMQREDYILKCRQGICPIYAAFDGGKIIGIMGMRATRTHINLAFTKKEYHRQGVATSIFQYLLADLLKENPALKEITLNSSPYGRPFYLHIGFEPLSDEQEIDGVRFTPMKYRIR
ncbi:MAG: GNAT family N-acetyltransferase [Lachnospiraceae bacterium]|nr:GNAT family N-acetyltransferase [Lachnospiraceae bacterium]MCM1239723.1 GNAT family N-acetyltransferase [Lachnospiraceae bacterium]